MNKPVLPEPDFIEHEHIEGGRHRFVSNTAYSPDLAQSILEQGIQYGREQMREECIKLCGPAWRLADDIRKLP